MNLMTKRLAILDIFLCLSNHFPESTAFKVNRTPPPSAAPVDHYENFPVASWLCPPRLRPAIAAIYWFARTADDIADEGHAASETRLEHLAAFRGDLTAIASDLPASDQWPQVFGPLQRVLNDYRLPTDLLNLLLDAFEQDVRFTAEHRRYQDDAELVDYCTRSANPVGRLLLHLYGIQDEASLAQSDQICTALQLINFWQDLSVDVPRDRWYPSVQSMQRHQVTDADLQADSESLAAKNLVADYVARARTMMRTGAPLACQIPGRAGWELRFVVQGALRILDKIETLKFATWRTRPKLKAMDFPVILWRAWRMGFTAR